MPVTFWFAPLGTNLTHMKSVNTLTDSDFAFQMKQLLDRNQIISHMVNKSEIHSTLSELLNLIPSVFIGLINNKCYL